MDGHAQNTQSATSASSLDLLHLDQFQLQLHQQQLDNLFQDPRYEQWENIYLHQQQQSFDFMQYRQQEDALSSAGSSSDGSYYQPSIYSASSDQLNPSNDSAMQYAHAASGYNYFPPPHQTTSTLNPRSTTVEDDPHSSSHWMYQTATSMSDPGGGHPSSYGDPYTTSAAGANGPGSQRDSGEFDYSSAGEDQPQLSSLHNYPSSSNPAHPTSTAMYFSNSLESQYPTKSDVYASTPPQNGNAYPSPFPSPNSHQQQHTVNSRLTPGLESLSIEQQHRAATHQQPPQQPQQQMRYPQSPLSPPSNQGHPGFSPPHAAPSAGPSRTQRSHGGGEVFGASAPYPRPSHHSHSHSSRHYGVAAGSPAGITGGIPLASSASSRHQQNASISTNSSASSAQSLPRSQYSSHSAVSNSNGGGGANGNLGNGGGKIFAPSTLPQPILPPFSSLSNPNGMTSPPSYNLNASPATNTGAASALSSKQKPPKQMVPGTPTHPDIPRPAIVEPPVPVPHLTKKSRGRQVPSVNSVHSVGSSSSRNSNAANVGGDSLYLSGEESSGVESTGHGGAAQSSRSIGAGNGASPTGHRSIFGAPPSNSLANALRGAPPSMPSPSPQNEAQTLEAELKSRPFVCTVEGCGKAYIRAEHLKRHVRSIHTNDKPYECPHPGCGREFSRYDNLCQHFKGVHGPTSSMNLNPGSPMS